MLTDLNIYIVMNEIKIVCATVIINEQTIDLRYIETDVSQENFRSSTSLTAISIEN